MKEYVTTLVKCSKEISYFFLKFEKKNARIIKKVYQCELSLDNLNPPLISHMMNIFSQWELYFKKKEDERKT
jgi:hypothetical protein